MKASRTIPYFIFVLAIALSLLGPHLYASIASLVSLVVIFLLFQKPMFLKIIFFSLIYQWVQINIKVWYGNLVGMSLIDQFSFYKNDPYLFDANYLSNIGLIAFTLGMYITFKNVNLDRLESKFHNLLSKYSPQRVLVFYILFTVVGSLLFLLRNSLGGINTLVVAIVRLKWGLLVFTYIITLRDPVQQKRFLAVILIEIVLGFTGYFSEFKEIILYIFIAFSMVTKRLTYRKGFLVAFSAVITIYLGFLWTAVKGDYRNYLSGGTEQQKVVVTRAEALQEFVQLVGSTSNQKIVDAGNYLLDRVSYIEFFSFTLEHVPKAIEHQNGEIWKNSFLFYVQPRILYPDKEAIDDSAHTTKYTGVGLVGEGQASHSLGYMADAYIDFGAYYMHIVIFLFGFVLGRIYYFFLTKSKNIIWGLIYVAPFFLLFSFYSFNTIKIVGNILVYCLLIYFARNKISEISDKYLLKRTVNTLQMQS